MVFLAEHSYLLLHKCLRKHLGHLQKCTHYTFKQCSSLPNLVLFNTLCLIWFLFCVEVQIINWIFMLFSIIKCSYLRKRSRASQIVVGWSLGLSNHYNYILCRQCWQIPEFFWSKAFNYVVRYPALSISLV